MTTTTTSLAELDRLEQRLAEIETPAEAKRETVWADAILELARGLGSALEEQNRIAEHRLRAQRRGGELIPQSGIGRGRKSVTLTDFGIDENDSKRWQAIARLPQDVFESYIRDAFTAGDVELTTAGLLKLAAGKREPKAIPEPGTVALEGPLMRYSEPDMPTAKLVSLLLAVCFPDAYDVLDATYGNGAFWDGSAHVRVAAAHDADPSRAPNGVADFRSLPYGNESYDVCLLDPPHISDAGEGSIMGARFGTLSSGELEQAIRDGVSEAWRVCRLGIIVKVCDHVHGQELVCESEWVKAALGGRPLYEVVHQTRRESLVDPRWQEQLSAYSNGSTYLVYRKGDNRHVRRAQRDAA